MHFVCRKKEIDDIVMQLVDEDSSDSDDDALAIKSQSEEKSSKEVVSYACQFPMHSTSINSPTTKALKFIYFHGALKFIYFQHNMGQLLVSLLI